LSRATLLHGHQGLLDEYNERVAEKLITKSFSTGGTPSRTVGFIRGIQQMMVDIVDYNPHDSYLGSHLSVGGLFHAKKEFYRLISLLLSDLGLIFDVRSPSPWQIISELHARGIFGESQRVSIKVCLSIANEIRLRTYFANNKQTDLLSPIRQYVNATEKSADVQIFRYFDKNIVVLLLSISNDVHERCTKFCLKCLEQDEIDTSVFENSFIASSNPFLMGVLHYRLKNWPEALEWLGSEPKDSPDYPRSLFTQGLIYCEMENGEYEKSMECFQNALDAHFKNENMSKLNVLGCYDGLAMLLMRLRQYEMARDRLKEAISKYDEVFGKDSQTIVLGKLLVSLGVLENFSGEPKTAIENFRKVEQLYNRSRCVPDIHVAHFNILMAWMVSEMEEPEQSLEYVRRAVDLCHKIYGEQSLTFQLAETYAIAAVVYERCNLNDKALSFFKQSLQLYQNIFGDNRKPGNMLNLICFLLTIGSNTGHNPRFPFN
jgi:tetratricopeptide (TPR) repeat protein